MEKNLQTWFATILGAVLLLVGIIGFINDPVLGIFNVNGLHNVVHLLSGAVLLWAGIWGGTATARTTNITFGIIYAIVALLGFVAPAFMSTLLDINNADNWLHVLLAVAPLAVGFAGRADDRRTTA